MLFRICLQLKVVDLHYLLFYIKFFFLPFIISLVFIFSSDVLAQQPYFKNFHIKDGLSASTVYDVFQDSKGFIWLATEVGVSRFTGSTFQNYTTDDGLSDNEVFNIYEDVQGRIWFLTFTGRPSFYKSGSFYNPENTPFLQTASCSGYLSSICEDSQSNLYIASNNGSVVVIDTNNQVVIHQHSKPLSSIQYLWPDDHHGIYFINHRDILYLKDSMSSEFLGKIPFVHYLQKGFTGKQSVYVANDKKVYVIDRADRQLDHILEFDEISKVIIRVWKKDGILWLGTKNGVYRISCNTEDCCDYQIDQFLQGKQVSGVLEDREGNWWFTTLDDGVFFAPSPRLIHYSEDSGLPENKIKCLSQDTSGHLWIGGINDHFSVLKEGHFSNHFVKGRFISNIHHFGPNETWVIGKDILINVDGNKMTYIAFPGSDMKKDRFGYYWVGMKILSRLTLEDLYKFEVDEHFKNFLKKPTLVERNKIDNKAVAHMRTICLELDNKDQVWVGTTTGLYCYAYDSLSVTAQIQEELFKDKINDIQWDARKEWLWVSTDTKGLYLIDHDTIAAHITTKEGLSSSICNRLYIDSNSNVWVGTANGLNLVRTDAYPFEVFNFSNRNGMGEEKINDIEIIDENIYLGTDNGLTVIPLDIIGEKGPPPPVYITQHKVNDIEQPIASEQPFAHFQNAVEFNFLGLSYKDQGKVEYRYRMTGKDDQWMSTRTNIVRYESLTPGQYHFQVKAISGDGVESVHPASMNFEIDYPFWHKNWFILLSFIMIVAIFFYLWKFREGNLLRKYQLEQRVVKVENEKLEIENNFLELEMRALRLQMNPHFLFNALNTIKGYYTNARLKEGNSYISKFAKLLRIIIENSEKFIPLEEEIQLLTHYIELVRFRYPNKFNYTIHVEDSINVKEAAIPPMLLQPLVENAILHGLTPLNGGGKLQINFSRHNGLLITTIVDNGIGLKASAKMSEPQSNRSKGMQITRDRLKFFNEHYTNNDYFQIMELEDSFGKATGTEVTIKTTYKNIWQHA